MNYDHARSYLLSKPEAFEDFPFGPDVAVMKIKDKMFATLALDTTGMYQSLLRSESQKPLACMNLKCDPDDALFFRNQFEGIHPGYHMNKRHWITLDFNSDVPESLIFELIDDSYELVVKGLRKKDREMLMSIQNESS